MVSRMLAAAVAASLVVSSTPAFAQRDRTPTSGRIPGESGVFGSDLALIFGAIAIAALIFMGATKLDGGDDDPVSP